MNKPLIELSDAEPDDRPKFDRSAYRAGVSQSIPHWPTWALADEPLRLAPPPRITTVGTDHAA